MLTSGAFGDLLDPRFQKIFFSETELQGLKSMLPELYTMVPSNGREDMRWSEVAGFTNWSQFSGTVDYEDTSQGFDTVLTPLEWTKGFEVERRLVLNDQFNMIMEMPKGLAESYSRTRETHAARPLNNAFSVDTLFYVNSEGVALCSNSHTTTTGASTATGFDNLATAPLTAAAVASNRITATGFRGPQGERFAVRLDELWIPPDLFEQGFEIVNALGKLDTANNNPNVHEGVYTIKEWLYFTDSNNFFMSDSGLRKSSVYWTDRVGVEFAQVEDFDTMAAKWRGYAYYGSAHRQWRWIIGNQVS